MAEERTLGLARARETSDEDASKEALQRRMEEARDSITNTVTEIKDNVAQQYENVKDALDWREHFKRQPVAWSLGAAGVGFFVGYGLAAALSSDDYEEIPYASQTMRAYAAKPVIGEPLANAMSSTKTNGKDEGPGLKHYTLVPFHNKNFCARSFCFNANGSLKRNALGSSTRHVVCSICGDHA